MPIPSLLMKGIAGLAAASVVSVSSIYFGTDLLKSKRSVSELIKALRKDKRLITGSSVEDPYWKAAWKKYRADNNSKASDAWGIKGWVKVVGEIPDDNAPQDFINSCKDKRERKIVNENNPLFFQVVSYCSRDTLVSDLIKENYPSKKILEKVDQGNSDGWKAAWASYKNVNTVKTKDHDIWKLTDWPSQSAENAPDTFMNKCAEKVKVTAFDLNNEDYLNAVRWCTQ
ncbi:hypothetical protein HF1_02510 [Mycoplasma haemofelis str. Langford 1]|uniref:Uncharacterized protein n=1 Tax=Mycoplasma haemofelis (strain Langford 1) TaxID=941640 RepID=E8ZKU3_MYCHL|nr:hypothetical protein [Mycoplasma haemofelis]CBY92259.1 hypothetical protein HF1_02510 [Mycoplasma haemofelis str. Langford 1]